jgi:glucokinase
MLLAGDIGGTKTVLALISIGESGAGVRAPLAECSFPSSDFDSLAAIIELFLQDVDVDLVTTASFGVAGPVIDDKAEITNLRWIVDAHEIGRVFDLRQVKLLNDLEALANAIPHLSPSDTYTLNEGKRKAEGAMAVIAPGTGLGEAFLTWDGSRYRAHPSEGGHASFAPNTPLQNELLAYLRPAYSHVSYERVCSGIGIPNIYRFLRDTDQYPAPSWLANMLAEAEDPTPIIAQLAEGREVDICVATMKLFVEILADEASNMALKVLATGGVYLGGGIPPRILPALRDPRFMQVFTSKGRFTELMERLPVYVIRNPKAALFGAAYYGMDSL